MAELINTALFNDANLQAYYQMDDVNDDKNSNNLTNNGSVTFGTPAQYGNAAQLGANNTTKALSLASILNYPTNGAYSVVLWALCQTEPGTNLTEQLFNIYDTASGAQILVNYNDNSGTKNLKFQKFDGGLNVDGPTYNVDMGTSLFHHIAMTIDGSGNIRGYFDGVLVGGPTSTHNGTGSNSVTGISIGANRNVLTANTFSGAFDDVAFFNRKLTDAEVALLASSGTTQEEFAGMDAAVMAQRNFYKRSNFSFMKKARAGFKGAIDYVKNKSGIYVPKGGILRPAYAI